MVQRLNYIFAVFILLLSIYSSLNYAADIMEECTLNQPIGLHEIDPNFEQVCVRTKDRQHELIIYDKKGLETKIDSIIPIYPWLTLKLFQDRNNQQWVVLEYYSDVDRQDGKTYRFIIYSLKSKERIFSSYSTHSAVVEDLDSDGFGEFVFSQVLVPIPYSIQVGWPRIYKIKNNIEAVNNKLLLKPYVLNYRSESLSFLIRFRETCKELESMGSLCKAEKTSINILEHQIRLVDLWIQQSANL
jgi:hypothetical protein